MTDLLVRCQICGNKIASNACSKCGKNVCGSHYDPSTGLCSACKQGTQFKKS